MPLRKPTSRCAMVLGLALTIAGCLPDRAAELAECQKEAARFYPTYRATEPDHPSGRFLIGCMADKGYDYSIVATDCSSKRPFPNQAGCYVSRTWLGWIAERLDGG